MKSKLGKPVAKFWTKENINSIIDSIIEEHYPDCHISKEEAKTCYKWYLYNQRGANLMGFITAEVDTSFINFEIDSREYLLLKKAELYKAQLDFLAKLIENIAHPTF